MNFLKNKFEKAQKGFTLIELLIVIAILAILATAVLVALDPVEQINRGRDAGKLSSISQLGNAVQAYYTVQQAYPNVDNTWQDQLIAKNEMKGIVSVPSVKVGCTLNPVGNVCYGTDRGEVAVWTSLESKANRVKAGNCRADYFIVAVWDSSQGKTGIECVLDVSGPGIGTQMY